MTSTRVPRVKVFVDATDPESPLRLVHVYPEGDGARWLVKELKKAGAKRPIARWPEAVWFSYSESVVSAVEGLAMRCMKVRAVVIYRQAVDEATGDREIGRPEDSNDA